MNGAEAKLRRAEARVKAATAAVVDLQHVRSDIDHRWVRARHALERALDERRAARERFESLQNGGAP